MIINNENSIKYQFLASNIKGRIPEGAILIAKSDNFKEFDEFEVTYSEFYACTAFRNEEKG